MEPPEEKFVDEKIFTSGGFTSILTVEQLWGNSYPFWILSRSEDMVRKRYLIKFMGISPVFAGKTRIIDEK